MNVIKRGGADTERLYLEDSEFNIGATKVVVRKSNIPGVNMGDLIARHKARYGLMTLFLRPGHVVLDFPCGSGYASQLFAQFDVNYYGYEYDLTTIRYAHTVYNRPGVHFFSGDLRGPHNIGGAAFDVVGCIEGLEHIGKRYQLPLIKKFQQGLKPGGVLVISSPENPTGKSGKSIHNKDHLWELSRKDFIALLTKVFGKKNVELVSHKAVLSTGVLTTCLYGICHKD